MSRNTESRDSSLSSTRLQFHAEDSVSFSFQGRTICGVIARMNPKRAVVITDDGMKYRVPYEILTRSSGEPSHPGFPERNPASRDSSPSSTRLQFHAEDSVSFSFQGRTICGVIARMNPKRAVVITDEGREYRVSYELLTRNSGEASQASLPKEVESVMKKAESLLALHGLSEWKFRFDNGTRRAGCCNYLERTISLSLEFCRQAPMAEIDDTLLHEIAHALVGKVHGHGPVWREKAIEIGCSGRRCHDIRFHPPRYIVTCPNRCFVSHVERRRRNMICKICHAPVLYATFTQDRWESLSQEVEAEKDS